MSEQNSRKRPLPEIPDESSESETPLRDGEDRKTPTLSPDEIAKLEQVGKEAAKKAKIDAEKKASFDAETNEWLALLNTH
jgi:hypothetical protein